MNVLEQLSAILSERDERDRLAYGRIIRGFDEPDPDREKAEQLHGIMERQKLTLDAVVRDREHVRHHRELCHTAELEAGTMAELRALLVDAEKTKGDAVRRIGEARESKAGAEGATALSKAIEDYERADAVVRRIEERLATAERAHRRADEAAVSFRGRHFHLFSD